VALDSFLSNEKSDFNIQAIKLTKVRRIQKSAFFELINSEEKYLKIWIGILENLVQQQMEREKDLLTESPLERYNRVLSRSPRLFQEIPHKYIANYLRMTPETLSRLKKS
jgi:CRP-like cAMP-binding protein